MRVFCWLPLLLLSVGAAGQAAHAPLRLSLSGSTTMAPLMREVARRFHARHPEVAVEVSLGGSATGISDVRQGKSDIGMVSRILLDSERDLRAISIVRDGVALIVHKDNPVTALSDQQLRDIYLGKIGNWRQVGGRDAPIHVLAGSPDGGSAEMIGQYLRLPFDQIRAERRVAANADRLAAVVADPLAIIWISLGEAERNARGGMPVKLLSVGGVAASSKSIRDGNYPISRPLNLVTRDLPSGAARTFIEFCVSSQITEIALALGFVPYLD
ncbi:MAG: phosphate ABC transporter substrate-binding protein [Burkholderiales bacterium]|nr:phosphate ABC transporter substrate-binding protein [Burkholderiales bacterium]